MAEIGYGDGRAETEAVIAALTIALEQGKGADDLADLEARLARAVAAREALARRALDLAAGAGTRSALIDLLAPEALNGARSPPSAASGAAAPTATRPPAPPSPPASKPPAGRPSPRSSRNERRPASTTARCWCSTRACTRRRSSAPTSTAPAAFAVTASDDKTVRVWSLADGALLRTIRLPAGPGNVGKAYAVAISPDGATIAAGGWTRWTEPTAGTDLPLRPRERQR